MGCRLWITSHICANKNALSSYTSVGDGEEQFYLGDYRTTLVLEKGKVLLKLTSGKTLTLKNVLHVPSVRVNLISVALLGKAGVKVSFEYDKIGMTKNNVFGKRDIVIKVFLYSMFLILLMNLYLCLMLILLTLMIRGKLD